MPLRVLFARPYLVIGRVRDAYCDFEFILQVHSNDSISQKRISPTPLADNNKGLGLLKWKGVVLDAETEKVEDGSESRNEEVSKEIHVTMFISIADCSELFN